MSWGVALRNSVGLGLGGIPSLLNSLNGAGAPDVLFDFAGTGTLDPRITFSRASNATQFDSAGNLVYAPHNLLTYSEQLDNAVWSKTNSTISPNLIAAPDGTLTADKIVEDSSAAVDHYTQSSIITSQAGAAYSSSIYIKAGERRYCAFTVTGGGVGTRGVFFDALTGTYTGGFGGGLPYTITNVGNGWFRYTINDTTTAAAGYALRVYVCAVANNITYTGDGTSGLYAWGAQLNIGALQPYYITTASAYYGPRFDYNPSTLAARGLLIEEQRTNSIRNNTMQGAVVGTPGTLPTNWVRFVAGTAATEVVAIGTEAGINYIDVRFSRSANEGISFFIDGLMPAPALNGQTWTGSAYYRLIAGSFSSAIVNHAVYEANSVGSSLAVSDIRISGVVSGAALVTQRISVTRNNTDSLTAFEQLAIIVAGTGACDFTLRIGMPQLEQGAFATSVIPTTTAAATRAADVATVTGANFSDWYNQTEGTFYFEGSIIADTVGDQIGLNANNNAFSERIRLGKGPITPRFTIVDNGSVQADLTGGTWTINTIKKLAGAYAVNSIALSIDGAAPLTDTSATIPTPTQLQIGNEQLANFLNGHVRVLAYYRKRLSTANLIRITR